MASAVAAIAVLLFVMTVEGKWTQQDDSHPPAVQPRASDFPPSTLAAEKSVVMLESRSATGNGTLDSFTTVGPSQLQYSFDCGNVGRTSKFAVTDNGNALASVLARSGFKVVNLAGSGHHVILVTTDCGWVVRVFGPAK